MTGAAIRGLLVSILVATPALIVPGVGADNSQITVLIALLAGILTFAEYQSTSPSIVEFRDAPPFNRIRFISLAVTVLMLCAVIGSTSGGLTIVAALSAIGTIVGNAMDFPYSPVRLAVLMLPAEADGALISAMRTSAGVAYSISLVTMMGFFFLARTRRWPLRNGAFNVWVNLPLFDPTAGGDVLDRLQKEARVNMTLGFLLPFLLPAVVKVAVPLVGSISLENPQTLIWTTSAWAFIPASLIMRGIAMARVAEMIEDKRRKAYASSENPSDFQTA